MIIEFGPWLPDQPSFGNRCTTATNVYPLERGYGPFPGPSAYSDALSAIPRGSFAFRQVNGIRETFAGTETGLYRLNGTTWDDVSNSGGHSSSDFWRFALYGDRVVATNGVDNPQKFDLSSDTAFSDLTNAPKHRFPMVVGDVLVALDLTDGSGDEVAFSAVNDSESWTTISGGGSQNFADGGPVSGGTGGEFGVILQESAVVRMNFVGGDIRFTFDRIEGGIGCIDAASIVRYRGLTFYLSDEGFCVFDGARSENISKDKVAKTFFDSQGELRDTADAETRVTADAESRVIRGRNQVQGALDPRNSVVAWSYPVDGVRKVLLYNYRTQKWAESDASVDSLHTSYRAAGPVLAGFDSSKQLALFNGANLTAVLSTGDLQLTKDRGTIISSVRALVDAANDVTVGKKTDLADTAVTSTGSSNANGKASVRSHGRYQSIQVSPTATFTEISGVEVEARPGARTV